MRLRLFTFPIAVPSFFTTQVMIRRLKSEVLTQLPAKRRQRVRLQLPPSALKDVKTLLADLTQKYSLSDVLAKAAWGGGADARGRSGSSPGQEVCRLFLQGRCHHAVCRYAHPVTALAVSTSSAASRKDGGDGRNSHNSGCTTYGSHQEGDSGCKDKASGASANASTSSSDPAMMGLSTGEKLFKLRGEEHSLLMEAYQATGLAKLSAVKEYVQDLLDSGAKLLLFAHHRSVMDALEASLLGRKPCVQYVRIDGGVTPAERHAAVERFQTQVGR